MTPELAADIARAYRRAAELPETTKAERARWTEIADEMERKSNGD